MAQQSSGMEFLCREYLENNYIDPETSERLGVKRGRVTQTAPAYWPA